ncbi:MAG: fatty acid desaturase CarF family protein, partial [Myxococcota bacterium]
EHHEVHHTAPHTRNYCITCGVMNPVLERVRFFRFAERVLFLLTGAHPLHHDASVEPSSAPSQSVGTQ